MKETDISVIRVIRLFRKLEIIKRLLVGIITATSRVNTVISSDFNIVSAIETMEITWLVGNYHANSRFPFIAGTIPIEAAMMAGNVPPG